ncbi:extracellular solute-binding protein [Streptomyces sp. HNM0574]|uniref:extracellular solute-binding protein n=1 Tax=Streptomyces sp. HNM0574 TaxID=2714954 RepID=UPI001469CD1F|nr:extracellular solute-binding protein [Streptomyces sp. HNM0574]NLU67069.1 extracellular solute-binding protein [Streptomyces sp. HNM0574]
MPVRRRAPLVLTVTAVLAAGALTACGTGNDPDTVKIAFPKDTDRKVTVRDDYIEAIAEKFEKKHPGKNVELIPIQAPQQDYYAKIQQMMRSPRTAPDLVYEDTFLLNSDVKSGYLRPLDGYLKSWKDWDRYAAGAKRSVRGEDGRTYGVPDGTDTRGLWFNRKIFAKAGLPRDWKPRTWEDVLDAARTVRKKVPGVVPLNVFTGKASGEVSAMQGFQPLLYGTGSGEDPLYDREKKKWVRGGQGFRDSLEFVSTVYAEKLGPDVGAALNPNIKTKVATEYLPEGKLAINLDGSWLGQQWLKSGGSPWPGWEKTMGLAPMPTQAGQAPGEVSMSGGWAWAIPRKSENPRLAWEMLETFQTTDNAVAFCVSNAQIAVRDDVAKDPRYLASSPGVAFFTERVKHTHYRPTLPVYPQVSTAITEAMEAVTTGDLTVEQAARRYDEQLTAITDGRVTSE